jgi:glyoxylate reductase
MQPKVLVTKHVFEKAAAYLRNHVDLDYHDSDEGLSSADLRQRIAGKRGLVCQLTDTIDAALMDAAPELEVIANVAVGYDNVDLAAARERRIVVTNTPGVLTETTADLAFTLLMATARRITEAERYLRAGAWRKWGIDLLCGRDIHGATLGLVGLGRIGEAVAERARGFRMRVLYFDPVRRKPEEERELDIEYAGFEELLEQSDFVSLHVLLDAQTHHLIGKAELERMKPTAMLINTTRGPVVDERALADALGSGTIAAAGLDVFENEPAIEPALLACDNVVLVPHIGSATVATRTRMCMMAAENCVAVLKGDNPPNPVT